MNLRDAVNTATNNVSATSRELSKTASDASRSTAERLYAFRELTTHDIGRTWMRRSRAVERDFGIDCLYLKFEGDNPTGTQKDRIAFAQMADALEKGFDTVALATCGNYGVAVALAAKLAGIQCHIFVPAGYHTHRLAEMELLGGTLHRPPGSYEDVVTHSSRIAYDRGWYDANPGGSNAMLQINAYAEIGREINRDLGTPPATCAVPVSNGTLLAGIFEGCGPAGGALVAASSTNKNPIVTSYLQGLCECRDLDPESIRETATNEPLINWHSFDGNHALRALHATRGHAYHISDNRMKKMAGYLAEREALRVLPASTAGLVALIRMKEEGKLPDGDHVAVLTAKR